MMKQNWIFSVRYWQPQPEGPLPPIDRWAVVGTARASTVETALHLAKVPEELCVDIRANEVVRDFVDGKLNPAVSGYYVHSEPRSDRSWVVCIGSIHEVLVDG